MVLPNLNEIKQGEYTRFHYPCHTGRPCFCVKNKYSYQISSFYINPIDSESKTSGLLTIDLIKRSVVPTSSWEDKDDFLDIVFWIRQVFSIATGLLFGLLPVKGLAAIVLFAIINFTLVYLYLAYFHRIEEDEFGPFADILKEGLMTAFASFMIVWIIVYDHFHSVH
ncbi:hypothetical protein Ciccas_005500 [Cichlidogyrus casuarinus]|uniref:Rab5-interacting protein n=1 Tax=Cichlidogyrus casuarinus TaxID=1844966 RepID=A0ABD2Q9F0_9PLAT